MYLNLIWGVSDFSLDRLEFFVAHQEETEWNLSSVVILMYVLCEVRVEMRAYLKSELKSIDVVDLSNGSRPVPSELVTFVNLHKSNQHQIQPKTKALRRAG